MNFVIGLMLGVLTTSLIYKKAEFRIKEVTELYEQTNRSYFYWGCIEAGGSRTTCLSKTDGVR